jgi:hypothetical protein
MPDFVTGAFHSAQGRHAARGEDYFNRLHPAILVHQSRHHLTGKLTLDVKTGCDQPRGVREGVLSGGFRPAFRSTQAGKAFVWRSAGFEPDDQDAPQSELARQCRAVLLPHERTKMQPMKDQKE